MRSLPECFQGHATEFEWAVADGASLCELFGGHL